MVPLPNFINNYILLCVIFELEDVRSRKKQQVAYFDASSFKGAALWDIVRHFLVLTAEKSSKFVIYSIFQNLGGIHFGKYFKCCIYPTYISEEQCRQWKYVKF